MGVFRCVITRLAGVLIAWFEVGEHVISMADFSLGMTSVFVLPSGLVTKWVTVVFVLPVVRFEVTMVIEELATNKVLLVLREALGGF